MGKVIRKVAIAGALIGVGLMTGGTGWIAIAGQMSLAAGVGMALSVVSAALRPNMNAASGAELRAPIRSAAPPKLLPYGNVIVPGVRVFKSGYGNE